MTDPVTPVQYSTEQLVVAMASGLLPLAGPVGLVASSLLPAIQQLYDTVTAHPTGTFSVEDLVAVVQKGNADLAKLTADVNAQA